MKNTNYEKRKNEHFNMFKNRASNNKAEMDGLKTRNCMILIKVQVLQNERERD